MIVYLYMYMHMYILMKKYAYMLLRSTTQYYVVIVLRSNSTTQYYVVLVLGSTSTSTTTVAASTVGYGGDHTMGVGGGCFSFGGTVQCIEESNIYLCFVVCRLKRGLVT